MIKVSAVVSAYNEEKKIKDCLESLTWANEIVFIDNSSTDKTQFIAQKYTKKIFKRPNYKMLNINKNFGFEKADGEWIINLDADERVSPELKKEILENLRKKNLDINGFQIPRKNIIFGKWVKNGIWWPDYQIRLFKKNKGRFPCQHVHEKIKLRGKLGTLNHPLIHYNYETVFQFVRKMNDIYTDNEAENFLKAGRIIYWHDAIRMPVNDFLANFFCRGSYKDGLHGLVLSIMQAFYSFLVFAKVWEKQKFWKYNSLNFLKETDKEIKKFYRDYFFWRRSTKIKNLLKKIFFKNNQNK